MEYPLNNKEQGLINGQALMQECHKEMEERMANSGLLGVTRGFPDLGQMTSGWKKSDFIIIVARPPSIGKSAFMLQLLRNAVVGSNTPAVFFSLKMTSKVGLS